MRPPENLNIIHIYNLIIPLKPQKDCNFPVTVSYKSTSIPSRKVTTICPALKQIDSMSDYSIQKPNLNYYSDSYPLFDQRSYLHAFHYSFRSLLRAEKHSQRFGLTVSFRRCPSSFYESYRMGRTSASTSLIPQLVQAMIPASTCGVSKLLYYRTKVIELLFKIKLQNENILQFPFFNFIADNCHLINLLANL